MAGRVRVPAWLQHSDAQLPNANSLFALSVQRLPKKRGKSSRVFALGPYVATVDGQLLVGGSLICDVDTNSN